MTASPPRKSKKSPHSHGSRYRCLLPFCARRHKHDTSCSVGGDVVRRHDLMLDRIFSCAQGPRLRPAFELAGPLSELGSLVDPRRFVGVPMTDRRARRPRATAMPVHCPVCHLRSSPNAWITALAPKPMVSTLELPTAAFEAYPGAFALSTAAARCNVGRFFRVPMVFAVESSSCPLAEAVLRDLAAKLAPRKGV